MVDAHETTNVYPNLSALLIIPLNDQQHFRLNKINEIKDYFAAEIKKRELMTKRLSKYIASFDYFDKSLIVLLVTTGSISVASFAAVIGAPVGIVSGSVNLAFSFFTGIVKKKKKLKPRNKKKKHNKFFMLARSKLNSIENKIPEVLMNIEISHADFMTIINKKTSRIKRTH